ncbi:tripartite motif-containing protein 16-like isoform X1 [Tachysurus vachellii]|uniref:tripartite motif-containing protein 16-like isoform X1 n=1 Tax=Tachysurus vachellii TaxID=175792 RepID=UPI00296B54E2|nr:tripartite motif-containing protein 16-like isoform X1 [Tachysurus vachellii]
MCTKSSSSFSLSEGSGEPFLIPEKTKVRVSLSCILSLCEFRKMAEASISVDQFSVDQFICPVCLDLLKDPVSLSCGHSFCKVCINDCWDQEDQSGVYSCPQCRDTFTPRPVLRRNNMLAEVVEKLKKTEVQAASLDHCYAGPGDVECDFCTERKQKAVKYCLMCVASFCETHLKPHLEIPVLKKHKLFEVSGNLEEKICTKHDKELEIYCHTDQSFICYLCRVDKHRGHDTVTAAEERTEKQNELQVEQLKSQQRLQEKQKKVQELKQAVNTIKLIAQTEVEDNERIFTELISFMEKKHSEVTEMIRAQEKAELSRTERLLEQLEQEIDDLQRRITEMEKLSHTHDDIHFLQEIEDLVFGRRSLPYDRPDFQSDLCEDSSSVTFNQHLSFQRVWKSLFDLKKRLEEICQDEFIKIPEDVEDVQILLSEPSRDEFLKYFCDLTLDPNTVNHHLVLSEENKAVSSSKTNQQYSDHPERFDYYSQVLSKESVCGRCYWEVEWSNRRFLLISVSYKDISRKGRGIECWFGGNNQSWSLECSPSSLFFWHNALKTDLRVPSSPRIGVYVDHSAGTLSFYSVSDTMKLLHRVHTTFTQPLYAGFWFSRDVLCKSTVRLCDQKQ